MKKWIVSAGMICGATLMLAQTPTAPKPAAPAKTVIQAAPGLDAKSSRAFLNQYCVTCHNSKAPQPVSHPVDLEKANLDNVLADAETWERVLRKLSVRAMPPQNMPRPQESDYAGFTKWLANSLDSAWAAKGPQPGRYVVHRLNRAEYKNAIRDLLALDVDVTSLLPSDDADFGFDNMAPSVKTSPMLLDRYVTAAQRISTLAVGNPKAAPGTTEYSISREFSQNEYIEGLPLGTRGGTVVNHIFPADGEYKLAARLFRGVEEGYVGVEGNDTPHTFVITIDGEEVFSTTIGGPEDHEKQSKSLTEMKPVIDDRMTGRVRVTAGSHDVGFTWRERPTKRQDVWQPALRDSQEIHMVGGMPKIRTATIEGPYNVTGVSASPSRERIFVCRPLWPAEEMACATRILTNLTRRAYRRPVTTADVETSLDFYKQARQNGETFDAGIRAGLARVLSSTSFIYRMENDAPAVKSGVAHQVSDAELASRLSFFFWSSIPDEKLLDLATSGAASGQLRQPGVLAAQVKRMIADERSDAFVSNFTGQWLQLRNLESKVSPDLLMFPDFDDNIRKGFRRETEMLFSYILRNDRSAMELLSADYTFLNERLAKHYGIPGVYGERFRQVKLTDPNRFGLLGHGSVLSLTALATRTSPVFRGVYVLTTFLGTPPPPPPPNVPALDESNKGQETAIKSVRDQLELHRKNQPCASCHSVIDPPGFALENFNSVGQWRSMDNGAKVDANGVLSDGSKLNGPVELREAILRRPEAFASLITERMMVYALGRGLEPSDMPVVRRIVKKAGENNYRLSTIVSEIINSAPFQMRTRLD